MLSTEKPNILSSSSKETLKNLLYHKLLSSREIQAKKKIEDMEGSRRTMINGRNLSARSPGRPIPRRGQVKVGIVVGLAHSVVSIFSPSRRWSCGIWWLRSNSSLISSIKSLINFDFSFSYISYVCKRNMILYSGVCISMNEKFSLLLIKFYFLS